MEQVSRENDVRGKENSVKKRGKRYSEEEKKVKIEKIVELYNKGVPLNKVSVLSEVSELTIRKWNKEKEFIKLNSASYSNGEKKKIIEEFVKFYNNGIGVKKAAKLAGTCEDTIMKWNNKEEFFQTREANKTYSQKEKENLIINIKKMYDLELKTIEQISKETKVSAFTIREWNKRYSFIDTSRTWNGVYSSEDKQNLINLISKGYEEGKSMVELSDELNITRTTIKRWNDEMGFIEMRTCGEAGKQKSKIYNYDENYFEKIDTPNKAYILGFLAGDGCVHDLKKAKKISLTLQEKDYQIILDIAREMNIEEAVKFRLKSNETQQNKYSLVINSTKMSNDLLKYGIVPRKTGIEKWVDLENESLQWNFLRGLMDSDGSVFESGYTRFYNSLYMLEGLQNFLSRYGIETAIKPKIGCFVLKVRKKAGNRELCKHLYREGTLKMNRKYDRLYKHYSDSFL